MKLLRYASILLLGASSAILLFSGGVLFWVAGTITGRLLGASLVLGSATTCAAIGAISAPTRRRRRPYARLAVACGASAGCVFAAAVRLGSPDPQAIYGSGLRSSWDGGKQPFVIRALSLLPEVDVLRIASALLPRSSAGATPDAVATARAALQHTYFKMQADPTFVSATGGVPCALAGGCGHTYTYYPEPGGTGGESPLPVLLIFHDAPANLKAALWPWQLWAGQKRSDRQGFIIAAPTCGRGSWRPGETTPALDTALRTLETYPLADLQDVTIVGVGTGVRAVPTALGRIGGDVSRVVLISPAEFGAGLVSALRGKPLLVVHGGPGDLRLAFSDLQAALEPLRRRGKATVTTFPDADRFLMLTQGEAVTSEVASWLARQER